MQNLNANQETYPYLNRWLLQDNKVEIYWDEETKSLVRAYLDADLFWQSGAEIQSLDQALKALNEFLEDIVCPNGPYGAEDFTEGWKHSD